MKRFLMVLALTLFTAPAWAQTASITLDWTAPGDDGNVGTATTYEMRYRTAVPDTTSQATIQTWWNAATPVAGLPNPQIAGTAQSVTVGGLLSETRYWFIMRAADERPNWSLFSNVATNVTPDVIAPAKVTDLRVR